MLKGQVLLVISFPKLETLVSQACLFPRDRAEDFLQARAQHGPNQ